MCDDCAVEVLRRRHQAGAGDDQVAEVSRQPLGDPQALRRRRILVVERAQLDRPQPLHVERVEILVADEREPPRRGRLAPGAGAARGQQGRILVLQPSGPAAEDVEEDVALEGEEAPEPPGLADHLLQVPRRQAAVPRAGVAGIHQDVPAALHRELVDRQGAGDDRRIDQRVIVAGAVVVRAAVGGRIHRGRRPPASGRELETDLVRAAAAVGLDGRDERGRAVQDDQVGGHPVLSDRPAIAGEAVRHDDLRRGPLVGDPPTVLPRGFDLKRHAVRGPGREALQLPGVVLDAIEARRPDRHHQLDRRAALGGHHGLDLGDVLLGRREPDRVDDRLGSLRGPGAPQQPREHQDDPRQAGSRQHAFHRDYSPRSSPGPGLRSDAHRRPARQRSGAHSFARSRWPGKGEPGREVTAGRPVRGATGPRPRGPCRRGCRARGRARRRLASCRVGARISPTRGARRRPTSAATSRGSATGCARPWPRSGRAWSRSPRWCARPASTRPPAAARRSPAGPGAAGRRRRPAGAGPAAAPGRGPAPGPPRRRDATRPRRARASSVKTSRVVAERSTRVRSTRLASLSWPRSMPRHTLLNARAAASSSSAGPTGAFIARSRRRA